MIFNKVTAIIKKLSRSAFGWVFNRQNKFRQRVNAGRHHQENPSGGMYGQLVSRDTTHRQF